MKRWRRISVSQRRGTATYSRTCPTCSSSVELVFDERGKAVDFRPVKVNEAYVRFSGKPREEVLSKTAHELYGVFPSAYIEEYARVVKSGIPAHFERYAYGYDRYYSVNAWRAGDNLVAAILTDITDIKEAQRRAEEGEARFRSVFENSYDAMLLTKPDGSILSANPAAQRMFGMTEEELFRGGRSAVLVKDERLEEALRHRAEAGGGSRLLNLRRKDGTTFEGEVSSSLFTDADGNTKTSMIIRDVSERKKAEEALMESEGKYRSMFTNSLQNIGIYEMVRDGNGEIVDWVVLDVNPPLEKQLGAPLPSMRGKRLTDLWGLGGSKDGIERSKEIMSSGEGQMFETEWGDRSYLASYFPIGKDRLAAVGIDITERKRAEDMLKQSEAKYRNLFEVMVEALQICELFWDENERPVDVLILDVNPAYERQTGIGREEVVGRRISEILPVIEPGWFERYGEVVRTGRPVNFEEYNASLDKWFEVHASALPERNHFAAIFTDITERKKAEEDLRRSNAELQQFAYVASHDLQEPLRMVTAYLGLLNKKFGGELSPQAKEYMSTAVRGSERMRQLIDDLLQFSRIDSRKKELAPVDLNKVARAVESSLHLAIGEAKAQVTIDPLPTVMADEGQMTQVLQNLVSNAIKFRGPEVPRVEVTAQHKGHDWIIAIKDNGIGIDPKYHENLFKMFQRLHTNERYPGTGIGLAISKKIVERHGGRIWVESKKGEGSTFFFTIPESGGGELDE